MNIPITMETIRTNTSLNFAFGILTFCGIWMPPSYAGTWKAVMYGMFSCIVYSSTIIVYLITESIDIYLNLGDMEKNVQTSCLEISVFLSALKWMNNVIKRQRVQRIMDKLDEPNFTRVSKANGKHLLKAMRTSNLCCKLLLFLALSTILLWGAFPLFDKFDDMQFPLRAWYPLDTSVRSTFVALYIYQVISVGALASLTVCQDSMMCSFVILICGQLDVLYAEISALGTDNQESGLLLEKNNDEGAVPRDNIGDGVSEAGDAKLQLRRCILHQKEIMDCIEEVESLFSGVIFMQFLGSCIVICVTAFQLSVTKFSVEFLSNVLYMCTVLGQLLFFCYPGNELMLKSQRISAAAYNTPWYDQDLAFKKMLLLVMERSKRPITVTAGRILPLTLQTLTSILRSSYSYYAVLHSVHDV